MSGATYRLGDECEKIGSGATPRGGKEVYRESGVSLIRSQNVYNDRFERDGLAHIGEEHARQLDGVTVREGDVLLNITGDSVARVCQAPADVLPARVNQHVAIIRPKPDRIDARYLRYYLASPQTQAELLALAAGGATRNALTKGMLEELRLPNVAVTEQRAIGEMLGALDDHIDNTRKQHATLAEVSAALFNEFVVSEGGNAGWQESTLEGIATFLNGLALQRYPVDGVESLPAIKISELRGGVTDRTERVSVGVPAPYIIEDGDLLFSWSGSLEVVMWAGGRGALNQHLFKVTSQSHPRWFVREWLLHHLPALRTIASDKATTMGHIQRRHLSEAVVTIPPEDRCRELQRFMAPIDERLVACLLQIRALADLRDALLLALLSGAVRVGEVEQAVEAV